MTINISSKDNERVKYTKSLLKSKNRQKESKFIIEGYRILTLAIECNADLDYVFINETFENKEEHKNFLKVLEEKNIVDYHNISLTQNELIELNNTIKYKIEEIIHKRKSEDEELQYDIVMVSIPVQKKETCNL